MFSHFIVISIATVFLLATISFISYLFCCRSATSPVDLRSQPEQSVEIGLDDTTINSWPKLTYTDAKRRDPRAAAAICCSICLVNYEEEGEGKALRLLPECGHLFHAACVDPWLRQKPTCPVCRSSAVNCAMLTPLAEVVPLAIGPA